MSLRRQARAKIKTFLQQAFRNPKYTVAFVVFLSILVIFWAKGRDPVCLTPTCVRERKMAKLFKLLDKFPKFECPSQFYLYHLHDNVHVYSLQTELISDTKREVGMCRVRYLHEDPDLDPQQGQEDIAGNLYEIKSSTDLRLIREVCDDYAYIRPGGTGRSPSIDIKTMNRDVIDAVSRYQMHMEKEETELSDEEQKGNQTDDLLALRSLMQGIYPGTKWCGFDSLANDVYSDLGTEPEVDACCRQHEHCIPLVESSQTRYKYHNPSILPVRHCKCDLELYNCFRKTESPVAAKVAHAFFNLVRMKCFDFGVRHFCSWKLFGFCLFSEKKCAAITRSNKKY